MKKHCKVLIAVVLFTVFFSLMIQAEETTIPQDNPVSDEMTVYFIRESAFTGAARRVWVACNENVVASIGSGNYCSFKVKSGPNVINAVQAKAPGGFYLLKYVPGETVYLLYQYIKGIIAEVPKEEGEKLVAKSKNVALLETTQPNDAFEFSVMNPGFFGVEFMEETDEKMEPDPEHAVITFIRPEDFIKNVPFGIWSKDGYLGTLRGRMFFQVKVVPGKHYFIGKSERFSVAEAEVEAGKNYYIQLKTKMGWNMAHIQLIPVKNETTDKTLQEWLASSKPVTYNPDSLSDELKTALMDKAVKVIEEVLKKVDTSEIETRKLLVDDARQ